MTASRPPESQSNRFEVAATRVLDELRIAVGAVIGNLPHAAQITKPADLQRQLRIDSKLAWQVHGLAFSSSPLLDRAGVPKLTSLQRFLTAAEANGVGEQVIEPARRAVSKLDEVISVHAGDFGTFESMLSGLSGGGSEQFDLAHRRAAFRASSHLWGVQVKTQLTTTIYHPGADSSLIDLAIINGMQDVRRLRSGAPFLLASHRIADTHHHVTGTQGVDVNSHSDGSLTEGQDGPSLLLDFCTKPCPDLDHRLENGFWNTYLESTPVGNIGAQTLYLAAAARNLEWHATELVPHALWDTHTNEKPVEVLVRDTLVQRDMFPPLVPEVRLLGALDRLGERDVERFRPEDELPMQIEVQNLGVGRSALATPHVPRYGEILEAVCRRMHWDPDSFQVFRCVTQYPVLGTVLSISFPLPARGNW